MFTDKRSKFTKTGKSFACALSLFLLTGCSSNFMVGDVLSLTTTDKTVGDHAISLLTNKDCSSVRSELGLSYCKEDAPHLRPQPKTYCYKELGKVTCYEQADLHSIRGTIEDKKEPPRAWSGNQIFPKN